jgi:hypothetical protein
MPDKKDDKKTKEVKPWQFKKGQSGNPNGRPKMKDFEALKELKDMSRAFVETKIAMALQRNIPQLTAISKSDEAQAIDVAISRIILRSCIEGDHKSLNFLFDRVVGKVIEKTDIKLPKPFVIESLDGKKQIECGMEMDEDDEE